MHTLKVGDKCQYNKKYLAREVVVILKILDRHCLVIFPSGYKLCTTLSGLHLLEHNEPQLTLF